MSWCDIFLQSLFWNCCKENFKKMKIFTVEFQSMHCHLMWIWKVEKLPTTIKSPQFLLQKTKVEEGFQIHLSTFLWNDSLEKRDIFYFIDDRLRLQRNIFPGSLFRKSCEKSPSKTNFSFLLSFLTKHSCEKQDKN